MDRRTTLRKFLGADAVKTNANNYQEDALPVSGGLTPYAGTWDYATAAHLLRRAMFGPTHEQILKAVSEGLQATLAKLFEPSPDPAPPVIYTDNPDDPNLNKGDVWVRSQLNPQVQGNVQMKENSLHAWEILNNSQKILP